MEEELRPICISNQHISVTGRVFVTDQRKRIHIKKPIRDILMNTINPVSYCMELYFHPDSLRERIIELQQQNVVPVLMYFKKRVGVPNEMQ